MNSVDTIELKAKSISFLSEYDEAAFFEWLAKISCISKFEGNGDTLFIKIKNNEIDQYELRELIALFYRYNIDMKQLAIFERDEFAKWFKNNKEAYWFNNVFGI